MVMVVAVGGGGGGGSGGGVVVVVDNVCHPSISQLSLFCGGYCCYYVVMTGRMSLDDWQDDETTPRKGSSFSSPITSAKKLPIGGDVLTEGGSSTPLAGGGGDLLEGVLITSPAAGGTPTRGTSTGGTPGGTSTGGTPGDNVASSAGARARLKQVPTQLTLEIHPLNTR